MKLNIKVISKAGSRVGESVCPWVMDVPPETARK